MNSVNIFMRRFTPGVVFILCYTCAWAWSPRFIAPTSVTISHLAPNSASTLGGQIVTITGTGLSGATNVSFGSSNVTPTILSSVSITAIAPTGSGVENVAVTAPGGVSGTLPFTYSNFTQSY